MSTLALRLWERGRALGGRQAGSAEEWSRRDAGHPEEDSTGSQEASEGYGPGTEGTEAKRPISRHTHPQHPQVQLSTLVGSGVGWLVGCKGDSEQTSIALGRTLASLGLSVFLRRMGETCCSDRYVPCEWWQACG